jgi:hypothetical protein
MRETEDAADSRLRENQKKTKAEADEDLREKTKVREYTLLIFSLTLFRHFISSLQVQCHNIS